MQRRTEYFENARQTPKRQFRTVVTGTDADYRAARTSDGQMLIDSIPDDSTFQGRLRGSSKDSEISVADVVGHVPIAANAWRFSLNDGRTGVTYDSTFLRKVSS